MRSVLICSSLLALVLVGPLQAASLQPLATSNQNPLVAIYGLPAISSAAVLEPGRVQLELRGALASSASRNQQGSEEILLDGETTRLTLALQYGLLDKLEVGLEVPYVSHREGFLDNLIVDWHDFFQLPQGERERMPQDRLSYRYQRDGQALAELEDEVGGFGDLRLTGAVQLWQETAGETVRSLALRTSLKLPSGDADEFTGSGSTDLALWLSGALSRPAQKWGLFGGAGALFLTEGDLLPDQQRQVVPFASLGAGWQPWRWLALKLQLDAHGDFYSGSDLRELSPSVQLAIGGTLALGSDTELDLGFSEDLLVDTAPDIVFFLALRQTF